MLPTLPSPLTCVDRALSARSARRCRAQQGYCFRNAFVSLGTPELLALNVQYVEGWVWDPRFGFAYHHGWNEVTHDGVAVVVDPTLHATQDLAYFAVLRLPRIEALAHHDRATVSRRRGGGVLPFVVHTRADLASAAAERFLPARSMAEAWGRSSPPHRALGAVLGLLSNYSELDCQGMTCAAHVLLADAGVSHTPRQGVLQHAPSGHVLPHWWIDLADGLRIDFRARRMLDIPADLPSGIFDPGCWPAAVYHPMRSPDLPLGDIVTVLDVDWSTLRAAVLVAVQSVV